MDNSDTSRLVGPPPAYGAVSGETNQAASDSSYEEQPAPNEPPPVYEAPKEGPYAQPTGQYPPPVMSQPGYPHPTQAFPPQTAPGYGATVHQTVIVRDISSFGPHPRTLECPNCHALITTQTNHVAGGMTWLASGLICLFGCWLGCCLIPFCVPELHDVNHMCPNCGRHVGSYTRL